MLSKDFYIFDMDGTITATISGKVCANHFNDFLILPNVYAAMHTLKDQGKILGLLTDQGGVSFGFMNEKRAWEILLECNNLLGGILEAIKVSYYHPKGVNKWYHQKNNKPNVDLFRQLQAEFEQIGQGKQKVERDNSRFVYVGNAHKDEEIASTCGVRFYWAHEFFNWPKEWMRVDDHGYNIKDEHLEPYRGISTATGRRVMQ